MNSNKIQSITFIIFKQSSNNLFKYYLNSIEYNLQINVVFKKN